eukprot:6593776-Prymnesium_polylepis.1
MSTKLASSTASTAQSTAGCRIAAESDTKQRDDSSAGQRSWNHVRCAVGWNWVRSFSHMRENSSGSIWPSPSMSSEAKMACCRASGSEPGARPGVADA